MREHIKNTLLGAITETQTLSGRSASGISGSTKPLSQLEGFDSYCAADTTLDLAGALDITIPTSLQLFKSNGVEHTIDEMTDILCEFIASMKGSSDV